MDKEEVAGLLELKESQTNLKHNHGFTEENTDRGKEEKTGKGNPVAPASKNIFEDEMPIGNRGLAGVCGGIAFQGNKAKPPASARELSAIVLRLREGPSDRQHVHIQEVRLQKQRVELSQPQLEVHRQLVQSGP